MLWALLSIFAQAQHLQIARPAQAQVCKWLQLTHPRVETWFEYWEPVWGHWDHFLVVAVVMKWFWWDVAPCKERDLESQFAPVKVSDTFSQHHAVFNILKEESWSRHGEQQSSSWAEISQDCSRNTACQIYGAASSFSLVQSWGFLTKNDLFHVHICFPPQILIFIYHTTGNQAVLAENQSIFVQNGISTSHGNYGFQYLLLPFSILGQVFLQHAAPRMCVDRESMRAKLEKPLLSRSYEFWWKKLRLQNKMGQGGALRDRNWSTVTRFWVMIFHWKIFFSCGKIW